MNSTDIQRLIDKVQKGDQKALSRLVEWGLDMQMELYPETRTPLFAWLRAQVELQRRRRSDYETAERVRAAKTAKKEALVTAAILAKRAMLVDKPRCSWTSKLILY